MRDPLAFVEAKRDGRAHGTAELQDFVRACGAQEIPDYQIAAWLMAVYFRGMEPEELVAFTDALARSGSMVAFPGGQRCMDKHSTGGVGDKTTLIVAPLAAACGVPVAKLSGRGLGFTGGTVDKLESIPGFDAHLSMKTFVAQVERLGCAVSGHSGELAPAEGIFYALRDVTGTVPSLPLICSSILGKKMAGGSAGFVFDVKCGSGAFMETPEEARTLAEQLVGLARRLDRRAVALITGMEQPLGEWVGNACEVREACAVLRGGGPADTRELCLELAAEMILLHGDAASPETARERCRRVLDSGEAYRRFLAMLEAQGVERRVLDSPEEHMELAASYYDIRSDREGTLLRLDGRRIGGAVRDLGGGRKRTDDPIDHAVGIRMLRKVGDPVSRDDALLRLYYNDGSRLNDALAMLEDAWTVGDGAAAPSLMLGRVGS
ncbi:MAG: thymidine phosphorylase [Synergistales bacterium]|nr:thymidine phosphorylase [Synergistales bacterium]